MSPQPIALDFARRRRWPGLLGWVLLALGLGMAALEVNDFLSRRADLYEREQIVERLRHQLQRERRHVVSAPEAPVRAEEASPALKLAAQLGRDWPALFASVDAAAGDGVAVLALTPDALRGTVSLSAEAPSLDGMFDFLGRLEAADALAAVELVSYEHEGGRFVFNLNGQWVSR
ncbi:hypothetical protein [Denitromonas ohlonensis]|jgi:hypothetical protein|uniref:PilN domain-containing protein n=2 Tax=Denitromonas TaxID=139331 RepID=A0A558EQD0_9RHOO|nr:hypothetical protein [Denitromonas ohlonensis]TVO60456.1 hypothetical protein FHP90_18555 [Denitromonas ohlonensis]TVO78621.1 hypothetical protein FHP89_05380 [Denitromonas ohlonensis]TVT75510.1 MAG: hypothetical protein FHP92_11160 [Denitromonas halophila]